MSSKGATSVCKRQVFLPCTVNPDSFDFKNSGDLDKIESHKQESKYALCHRIVWLPSLCAVHKKRNTVNLNFLILPLLNSKGPTTKAFPETLKMKLQSCSV